MVDYKKPKIFIVDDNPELFQELLPEYGYELLISKNGKEALDIIVNNREKFDILLLDILLPEVNGWDILRHTRDNEEYKHTPIIMMSALHNEIDFVSSLKVGADDYIAKPFNLSVLMARIEALLRRSSWPKISIKKMDENQNTNKLLLTSRENDIMNLVAKGLSNKRIAENLFVSELTVKTHLKNIFKKLSVNSRTQAILSVMGEEIISKE